mgnify:CR=1 FL=1
MSINKLHFQNKTILVIGDLILDEYLLGEVERISPEAPVPILKVLNTDERLGGAGNVAFNCKSLGCNVEIVSITGNDIEGQNLINKLSDKKIKCFIEKNNQFKTVKKTRLISRSQQILRIDDENIPPQSTKKMVKTFIERIKYSDIITFSDYDKGTLIELPYLIKEAKKFNKKCLVDPKGNDPFKFKGAYLLTPNLKEMDRLIGHYRNETEFKLKVFKMMEENDIQNIALTQGKDGLTLFQYNEENEIRFQGNTSEVFDVTGAGDTVISVLSVLLSINYSLIDACEIANKAGGIIVQKFGTTSITFEDIF